MNVVVIYIHLQDPCPYKAIELNLHTFQNSL